jgi:hypothetical protein
MKPGHFYRDCYDFWCVNCETTGTHKYGQCFKDPRIDWSKADSYSRTNVSLSPDYMERSSNVLEEQRQMINIQTQNPVLNVHQGGSSGSSHTQMKSPNIANASTTADFSVLNGLTDYNEIQATWWKAMEGHCGKRGHWAIVCLTRLTKASKAQNVSALVQGTVDPKEFSAAACAIGQSEAAGVLSASKEKERAKEDLGAELAALRNTVAQQQEQIAEIMKILGM